MLYHKDGARKEGAKSNKEIRSMNFHPLAAFTSVMTVIFVEYFVHHHSPHDNARSISMPRERSALGNERPAVYPASLAMIPYYVVSFVLLPIAK